MVDLLKEMFFFPMEVQFQYTYLVPGQVMNKIKLNDMPQDPTYP